MKPKSSDETSKKICTKYAQKLAELWYNFLTIIFAAPYPSNAFERCNG